MAPAKEPTAPSHLGSLQLVGVTEGSEALSQINKLHGTNIDLVSGYIATYAGGDGHAMVWVGGAESRETAEELTARMVKGIEKGNTGFSNPRKLTVAGHEVWQVDGGDGQFFFYNSLEPNSRVVWITIEGADAMPILEQVIKAF